MTIATFLFLLGEFIHAKFVNFFDFKLPACVFGFIEIQLNVLLNLQVVFLIWSVKVRYNAINKFLKLNFQTKTFGFCHKLNERQQIELLNETGIIHDHLVDVTNLINQCYGLPVIKFSILLYFHELKYVFLSTDYVLFDIKIWLHYSKLILH